MGERVAIVIGLMSLLACNPIDVPEGTPRCIKKDIRKDDCIKRVSEYEFGGETVYLISKDCASDDPIRLYDENCEYICAPSGGISGNGDGLCPDFYDKAVKKQTIWERD